MIIICPSCHTRYQVEATRIGPAGRTVRCYRCKHHWKQAGTQADEPESAPRAPAEELSTPPPATPAARIDSPVEDSADSERSRPSDVSPDAAGAANLPALAEEEDEPGGWLKWVILLVVIGMLAAGFYFFRVQVVSYWPASERLYQALQLDTEEPLMHGLEVQNVGYERVRENGQEVIIVRGEVANLGGRKKDLPRLRVALIDAEGTEIFYWTVTTAKSVLVPGERVPFSTRLPNPPEKARNLVVTFIVNG